MGCCLRKAGPVRITVTEAPDYPIRIRLRLRGDLTEATTEKIAAKLCQVKKRHVVGGLWCWSHTDIYMK